MSPSSTRTTKGALTARRLLQGLAILIPSFGIFRLHQQLLKGSAEEFEYRLFQTLTSYTEDFPTADHGAIARHLSMESNETTISLPSSAVELVDESDEGWHRSYVSVSNEARQQQNLRQKLPQNSSNPYTYIPVGKYVTTHKATTKTPGPAPYAYSFVMGGVNEQDGRYLGMLYNILIAAYILQREGSKADIVVFVQMSPESDLDELPVEDVRFLKAQNVVLRYIPKPQVENFHQIIMQKMVVLDLMEYRRVIFLDTDVMPYCNLDYVFELSEGPGAILKKNLIIALSGSPANAGFFMLTPGEGELAKIKDIVAKQQEKAKDLPYPHFDDKRGWGHAIKRPDKWWTINRKHSRQAWKFVGSHADQGLLYHWVKYVKRSVSIVTGVEVDNYVAKSGREKIQIEETMLNPFDEYTCLPAKYEDTFGEIPTSTARGMAPYRDFAHFLGSHKPWKRRPPEEVATNLEAESPLEYWFHMLRLLNEELQMNIDFDDWQKIKTTPLGSLPKKDLMIQLMAANQSVIQA